MNFTEARYFVLFGLVFGLYWAVRGHRLRKVLLLSASAVFYGVWSPTLLGVMYFSVTVDFVLGQVIARTTGNRRRRLWLLVSCAVNLGLLGFFKYCNFFVANAAALLQLLGFTPHVNTLAIALPIGISFYTFQSMSYTIDVYRRQLPPVPSYLDFALYVTFFPQLVAGPIVRATGFIPQLARARSWTDVRVRACLQLFLVGFVKKAVLADHIAPVIDPVFLDPGSYDALGVWSALLLYHVQIYADFSGYSDMAIASAGLLGYQLPQNFAFPYLVGRLRDFWRRWHISLGTWLRDYLYFPLGGGRLGAWQTARNLLTTMTLFGFWHGANWNFVLFGTVHGVFLAAERLWVQFVRPGALVGLAPAAAGWLATHLALLFSWTLFRGDIGPRTWAMIQRFFLLEVAGPRSVSPWWLLCLGACGVAHWVAFRGILRPVLARLSDRAFAVLYGLAWALVLPWVATGYRPFIYFQF